VCVCACVCARRKEERIKSHFEELLYGQGFMHAERETVQKVSLIPH
jgi:hypothetical protein